MYENRKACNIICKISYYLILKHQPFLKNLYSNFFLDKDKICENLDFDKATTLEGYEIRLNAVEMEPYIKVNLSAPDYEKFRGDNSEIIKILLFKLGASLSITLHNGSVYELGGIGPNGTLVGLMAPLSDGTIDIGMNTRSLLTAWKVK